MLGAEARRLPPSLVASSAAVAAAERGGRWQALVLVSHGYNKEKLVWHSILQCCSTASYNIIDLIGASCLGDPETFKPRIGTI